MIMSFKVIKWKVQQFLCFFQTIKGSNSIYLMKGAREEQVREKYAEIMI